MAVAVLELTAPDAWRELAVTRSGVLAMGRDSDLAAIVAAAAASYHTALAGLSIITGGRQVLLSAVGMDVREVPREQSFCATTIQRPGEPLVVLDARRDTRFAGLAAVAGEPFVRFYAGVPIIDRNGYALGALCVADAQPRTGTVAVHDLLARGREVERLLH